jgi:hypothetical protein
MRQHSIDLLPESVRARGQAGLRMGRFIAISVAALSALVVTATHSRVMLRSEQEQFVIASAEANQLFATETRAVELRKILADTQAFTSMYDRIALPLDVSAVAATVINALPESVTLDQLDVDAGARMVSRSPRSKGVDAKAQTPPRVLTAEVSGFASTDQHIAELVAVLEATPPFRDVNLDFSRTRRVNGRDAREFRLSFRIDLDTPYTAPTNATAAAVSDVSGGTHVQQ